MIVFGHVAMVFHSLTFFYGGLTLIAIGTGLLKPNISTMVGSLYSETTLVVIVVSPSSTGH